MGFSLYNLFKAGLLLFNAASILNSERFLKKYSSPYPDVDGVSLKSQALGLVQATAYLKVPLIICNLLIILVELVFGG